jgi:hypothetical protein
MVVVVVMMMVVMMTAVIAEQVYIFLYKLLLERLVLYCMILESGYDIEKSKLQ